MALAVDTEPPNTHGATLTRPRAGSLASLQPLRVVPPDFSTRARVVVVLRRIEFLRVVPSTSKAAGPTFDIQVFCKPREHHIPLTDYSNGQTLTTHAQWRQSSEARKPDVVVRRSLVELSKLHDDLFSLARIGHGLEPCAFCLGVITYCGYTRVKPQRSMTWVHRRDSVGTKLSVYLNDLLKLVLKVKTFRTDHCTGQENIPIVFYRLFQADTPRHARSVSMT